jgi:quercetin 2,3-dioxygenase
MKLDRRTLLRAGFATMGSGAISWISGWNFSSALAAQTPAPANGSYPDEILNPVEVHGADAIPVIGKLPGARRLYVLPDAKGEYHLLGSLLMTRIARPQETGGTYELATFAGVTGSAMPRHTHLASHSALLVMAGDVEMELADKRWRMLRGDFANIPPGTPHSWTMRSDRGRVALFTMGDRSGAAYAAMGSPANDATLPASAVPVASDKLAQAAMAGDFQLAPANSTATGEPVRVSNLVLPATSTHYVLLDGGGERYGGNTFCAKDANTNGQFLFIMTEGGSGGGVGAHFHARHTEDFFALDGETRVWAYGQAVPLRSGDFVQAPPRNMHGFKMMEPYNRFVGFLTPGIFENFFTHGQPGQNGVGGRGGGEGSANTGRGGNFGGPGGRGGFVRPGPGTDMFRQLMMSGVGPDGYPLDVHGPTLPLPPQDPLWTSGPQTSLNLPLLLREHGKMLCGGWTASREITPELKRALRLKPKAESFV